MQSSVLFETHAIKGFDKMREILDRWYICPSCGALARGWFYSEKLPIDGDPSPAFDLKREFGLTCKHKFSSEFPASPLNYVKRYLGPIAHHDIIDLFVKFETKSRHGLVTQRLYQRSDSYQGNYIGMVGNLDVNPNTAASNLFGHVAGGTSTTVTALAGIVPDATTNIGAGIANGTAQGMFVGTGTTANSADTPGTCALATPITNGTGAGELQWSADAIVATSLTSSTYSYEHIKTFTNNSAGNITITEVGVFWENTTPAYVLILRDVLGTAVTVDSGGGTTTGIYLLGITVS